MTTFDKLIAFRDALRAREPTICGEAPAWIVEVVLENLEKLIAEAESDIDEKFVAFRRSASRFVRDSYGWECDTLMENLYAMLPKST